MLVVYFIYSMVCAAAVALVIEIMTSIRQDMVRDDNQKTGSIKGYHEPCFDIAIVSTVESITYHQPAF